MMFGYTILRFNEDTLNVSVLAHRLYEVSALRDEMLRAEMEQLHKRYPASELKSTEWAVPL